jgi:uncharacterized protein YjiS (DUF1127 family)
MAYLLSGERSPLADASSSHPFGAIVRWFAKVHSARARRTALSTLLEMEDHRLDDLGLCRQDIAEALRNPDRGAGELSRRRADRSKAWRPYY